MLTESSDDADEEADERPCIVVASLSSLAVESRAVKSLRSLSVGDVARGDGVAVVLGAPSERVLARVEEVRETG